MAALGALALEVEQREEEKLQMLQVLATAQESEPFAIFCRDVLPRCIEIENAVAGWLTTVAASEDGVNLLGDRRVVVVTIALTDKPGIECVIKPSTLSIEPSTPKSLPLSLRGVEAVIFSAIRLELLFAQGKLDETRKIFQAKPGCRVEIEEAPKLAIYEGDFFKAKFSLSPLPVAGGGGGGGGASGAGEAKKGLELEIERLETNRKHSLRLIDKRVASSPVFKSFLDVVMPRCLGIEKMIEATWSSFAGKRGTFALSGGQYVVRIEMRFDGGEEMWKIPEDFEHTTSEAELAQQIQCVRDVVFVAIRSALLFGGKTLEEKQAILTAGKQCTVDILIFPKPAGDDEVDLFSATCFLSEG